MAKEAIQSILDAENKAKTAIQEAKEKADKLIVDGNEVLAMNRKKLISDAENKAKEIRKNAELEAREYMQPILDKAEKEAEELRNIDASILEPAVSEIVKEVMLYGNS